ncbi:alpha-2-macroglobulin family protein [Thermospira aquatica]|uniref:Alpha-2-macroglobulin n=1 Tax=Thermospira aquatica TaxID=2828656 RepID=A0AAX3BAB6_9SPIR|nr:MG2 domain-containing protein [Thermospira aquatica]URA09197.1 hypothetical protein KDW03_06715 [Thermospira aquatica]
MWKWMGGVLLCWGMLFSQSRLPVTIYPWDLESASPVRLVFRFDTPVVKMSDIASMTEEVTKNIFFDFSPRLKYRIEVIDEQSFALTIEEKLLPARRYYLTVRISTNFPQVFKIGGKKYSTNELLFFDTPSQEIVRAEKASELPDAPITISFRFPVEIEKLRSLLKISMVPKVDDLKNSLNVEISFSLRYSTNGSKENKSRVLVIPKGEKEHSDYILTIDKALTPIGGELPMKANYQFKYATYKPLRVVRIGSSDEKKFYRDSTIVIFFNNPLPPRTEKAGWVKITPAVQNLSVSSEGKMLYVSGVFVPGTRYKLVVQPLVTDIYRQTLDKESEYTFEVEDSPSFYSAPAGYLLMENYLANLFPIKTRNIEKIFFSYRSLTNEREIFSFLEALSKSEKEALKSRIKDTHEYTLPPRWNSVEIYKIPLKRFHPSKSGFLLYEITVKRRTPAYSSWEDEYPSRGYVQFSDMAATLKRGPWADLLIARYLKNNAPVTNAEVYSYRKGQLVLVGKTGSLGTLLITNNRGNVYMLKTDKSRFFLSHVSGKVSERVNWGSWYAADRPGCVIFTERYLYQPGERVFIKGIYRYRTNDTWTVVPFSLAPFSKDSIEILIEDSRGETLLSTNISPTSKGSFDLSVVVPKDAPTGTYSITASVRGKFWSLSGYNPEFYSSFQVEEFRPARAEMKIQPNKPLYLVGESMRVDLIGWYLFGAPIGRDVEYSVGFRPTGYSSKRFPSYSFSFSGWYDEEYDEYGSYSSSSEISSGTLSPDKNGVASLKVDLTKIEEDGFLSVWAKTTLPDNTPVSGYKGDIEVRKKLHLGLRVPSYFHFLDKPLSIDLVAVDGEDKITTNEGLLVVTHHEWNSFLVAGHGGRYQWEWREVVTPVYSNTVKISQTTIPIKLSKGGSYVATVYERRGKKLIPHGKEWFYVIGGGFYGWRISEDDRTEVISDKSSYDVGETATLLIKNPYKSARALITIEREKFYKTFDIPATNSMVIFKLPIEKEYIPNVYVSVILYTGRTGINRVSNDVDFARPQYRIGYANLSVIPKEKSLQITVNTDKATYTPREKVTAKIQIRDHAGKPVSGEVTISVADRGVLNLAGYSLPNPLSYFYQSRSLAISTYETRNFIYGQRYLTEKGEILGGDGGISLGMIVPRAIIKYTAFYEAKLDVTNGEATVSFTLPDNLSSFKVMAVAHTPDSMFGYGENTFTVKKPLMVLESFPTFVRMRDSFMAGGIIFNYTGQKQTFTVEMSTGGGLRVGGDKSVMTNITLENNTSQEVLFPVKVTAKETGETSLTMKVKGTAAEDGITKTIPVTMMRYPETVAIYGMLSNGQNQAVNNVTVTSQVIPELSSIETTVAPTAFVELKGNLDYLVSYPYGCAEQKTSKILPLITGEEVILKYRLLATKTREDLREVVQSVLKELPEYFKGNGFSYWKDSTYVSSYLTVYIFWVMTLAKERGYRFESSFYEKVFQVVKDYISKGTISDESFPSYRWLALSYALYVASLNNYNDVSRLRWGSKQGNKSPLDRYTLKPRARGTGSIIPKRSKTPWPFMRILQAESIFLMPTR